MFSKHIFVLIISSIFAISTGRLVSDVSTTTPASTTTYAATDIRICADLKPRFISTRQSRYQTLECTAKLCTADSTDTSPILDIPVDITAAFNNPVFEWNCQLGHIESSNGTCDLERGHCWHTIDIDLWYFRHKMWDNGLDELQISCTVSDAFLTPDGNHQDILLATDVEYSYIKSFKGKAVNDRCQTDSECGDNMFCLNTGTGNPGITATTCQCRMDYITGVQFVQIMDDKYNEWLCAPPLLLNESCLYDSQCQAMDVNTICDRAEAESTGRCVCDDDMVAFKSGCQPAPVASDTTRRPTIIWWIFTDDYREDQSQGRGFWWLRWAAYVMAIVAIILPFLLVIIAMVMLCHRRSAAKRAAVLGSAHMQGVVRPRFPAPKVIISELKPSKEKSDDKYGLVQNDHLSNQY